MVETIRIIGRMPPTQGQSTIIYQSKGDDERFQTGNILLINQERFHIANRNPLAYAPTNQTVILTLLRDRTTRRQRREQAALMDKVARRNRRA